jgi:hypothetical protein
MRYIASHTWLAAIGLKASALLRSDGRAFNAFAGFKASAG